MTKKILAGLFIVAVFALGLLAGRNWPARAKNETTTTLPSPTVTKAPLPPVTPLPKNTEAEEPRTRKTMSLAEAEAAIENVMKLGRTRQYEKFREIAESINTEDIPELLRFLDQPAHRQIRSAFTAQLLPRWAKVDLQSAMAYADSVQGINDRQQAVTAVVRGWAEVDATAAAAWVQKLPPSPLRGLAVSSVAGILAEKDPEAALALAQSFGSENRR